MRDMEYDNFDLQVDPISKKRYRVQVLESTAGQAEYEFGSPFTKEQQDEFNLQLGRTRQAGVRPEAAPGETPRVEHVEEFGARLFNSLFGGVKVYACYHTSLEQARSEGKGLRIRLRLNSPELSSLPWEYLYDPDADMFLARSIETPVVRYIELDRKEPVLLMKPPLTMLVMISNPSGDLDVEKEWSQLSQALAPLAEGGVIRLERLAGADFSSLQRRLRKGNVHIFHFIGHGDYDEQRQEGGLLFESETGQGVMLDGEQLGLHNHRALRLAVLNACEGARTAVSDPFSGVAQRLVQLGVPAVVAMQFPVSDRSAITFAREFYGALADGFQADAALVEARTAISAQSNNLEWGTPVYFTRADHGRLFDIPSETTASAATAVPPDRAQPAATPDSTTARSTTGETPARQPAASPGGGNAAAAASAGGAAVPAPGAQPLPAARAVSPLLLFGGGLLALVVVGVFIAWAIGLRTSASPPEFTPTLTAAAVSAITQPAGTDLPVILAPTATATGAPTDTSAPAATATSATTDTPIPATDTASPTDTPVPATDTPAPAGRATRTLRPTLAAPPTDAAAGDIWVRPMDGMEMVFVPAGEFLMGSPVRDRNADKDENPQRKVAMDAFWIDGYEVTNAMFNLFIQATGYRWNGAAAGDDNQPVVNVSWNDAAAYCKWVGGKLPSEAQWEKAARGDQDERIFPWGDQAATCDLAVMNDNGPGCGKRTTWPVGSFPEGASPYGVYDLAGNVWEWVQDWYNDTYYFRAPNANPSGQSGGSERAMRGGSWQESARNLRVTNRGSFPPTSRASNLGFRCAR